MKRAKEVRGKRGRQRGVHASSFFQPNNHYNNHHPPTSSDWFDLFSLPVFEGQEKVEDTEADEKRGDESEGEDEEEKRGPRTHNGGRRAKTGQGTEMGFVLRTLGSWTGEVFPCRNTGLVLRRLGR